MTDTKMTTLLGGVEMIAEKQNGERETVKVRQLPIRKLTDYAQNMNNEAAMVELFCGKPEGWSDELTIDCFVAILQKGEELNREHFFAWLQRQLERQDQVMKGEVGKRVASLSQTSLPKPQ